MSSLQKLVPHLITRIADIVRPQGILNISEFCVPLQAALADAYGLPGSSPEASLITMSEACMRLKVCGINANARHFINAPVLRLGVQEITRLGMNTAHMSVLVNYIARAILEPTSTQLKISIREFRSEFKTIKFSFDEDFYE